MLHRSIQRIWDDRHVSPTVAILSAIAAVALVPYALSKGQLTTTIVAKRWTVAGMSPDQTALLVHVLETVPLLLIALGLVSLHAGSSAYGRTVTVGLAVALLGFAFTILSHVGEHVLSPLVVPALAGDAKLFVWSYYVSWLTLYAGFGIYGVGLVRVGVAPSWIRSVFVAMLPATVALSLTVVVLDVFTFAGTFRVVLGLTWLAVGIWLWWVRADSSRNEASLSAH